MGYVVAVAAPIGGGKTTFVRAVAEALGDAQTLHFDRYEKLTSEPMSYLRDWMKNGADFNDFHVPELPNVLEKLKAGDTVVDPATRLEIKPTKYVIFEMPLGKEHLETARFIDLLVWIEIPLDIALARKIKEFTERLIHQHDEKNLREGIAWMDQYLDNYLQVICDILRLQHQKIRPTADIIINGTQYFERAVREATQAILKRLP
jgi:uridine kinase